MRLLGLRPEGAKTRLFAPFGIRSFLGTSISGNRSFDIHELVPPLSKRAMDQSVKPMIAGPDGSFRLLENDYFSVLAVPIKHTVFCAGYVIVEKEQRGHIDAVRLTNDFHIPPGPIYRQLLEGKAVHSPDGREVRPEMVIGPARPSRKIVVLGDTCDPSAIGPFAEGADVLVHEATCADADRAVALSKGHSTAGMAGAFARQIGAKRLILNHFSPRGFQANEYEEAKSIRQLVLQARTAFGSEFVYAAKVATAHNFAFSFAFLSFFRTFGGFLFPFQKSLDRPGSAELVWVGLSEIAVTALLLLLLSLSLRLSCSKQ
jgi:ribonuclease BN (tRNA processing enzyme)